MKTLKLESKHIFIVMNERVFFYDFLRVIACLMIVVVHSPASHHPYAYNNYFAIITYTMMVGVPLFFMISGALLLPSQLSPKEFFKRRLSKVVYPIVFWTIVYTIYQYFVDGVSLKHLVVELFGMPFSNQGAPELWFMYTLLGLYVITPVISPFIMKAKREDMELYLFIWGVTLFLPYIKLIWDIPETGIFTYVSGYIGFFFLGSYLHRFYNDSIFSRHTIAIILICMILWVVPMVTIKYIGANGGALMEVCTFPLAALTVVVYLIVRKLKIVHCDQKSLIYRSVVNISMLSFGIYLSHSYLCKRFLRNWDWMMDQHIIVELIVNVSISFFIAWMFSWLVSKSKWSKYIIGV